jgi:hypothetical protein
MRSLLIYTPPQILFGIKAIRMRWAGHVARMVERGGVYRVLVGELEGKRHLGRPSRRWENYIEMDLQKMGCEGNGLDWFGQKQVSGICECGNELLGSIKYGEFLD